MQLTIRDVSRFLDVGESTVTRWITQRGLPAQYVGGQYRCNRAELLEWATTNQIKVSPEMFDHPEVEDEPIPNLAEALEAGGIFYQLQDTTKERALRGLVQILPLPDGTDRELLLRLFLAREASATTAIGGGIALPHVRNPIVLHVARPMVTLCFLERPVDFGALDGKPVQVLFSLVCPTMRSHLQMLARLSFALHDARFKEAVMRRGKPEEILQEARRVEAALAATAGTVGKAALSMDVLLIAIAIQVASGTAALLVTRFPRVATMIGAGGAVAGCLLGLMPTCRVLLGGTPESLRLAWDAAHGPFRVELDALSAFFLLPVLGLSAVAAVYGGNYLLAYRRVKSLGSSWFFFNVFVAGMALVVLARTAVLFLMAWEVMSLAAFCLVTFEHEKAEVRQAGWVYLIATHLGVAFLVLAFVLLGREAGSLEFESFRGMPELSAGWSGLIFVLALIGFGAKAGFVPFHVWLPEAHPAAPSHVSALMSGVMIKMGLYGVLRVLTFLGQPAPWWGLTLAALGLLTALVGIALAMHQRDVKRVLAYSSIENMGLMGLALGVGLWGWASRLPEVAALGMTAAFLHVWNHALMKGLMFFAAGGILHGTGTKDMEKLGGLMKRMPWTAGALMTGAVAIAALPPLNGFVSKWLMYLSLLKCGFATNDSRGLTALLAIGFLALIGALAALAFVRLTGIVLLGSPRSEAARHAHEPSPWMLGPMVFLVLLCLMVAVFPQPVVGLMRGVLDQVLGPNLVDLESSEAPLDIVGRIDACTMIAVGVVMILYLNLSRRAARADDPTWGCGYVRPTERMQYTGRSFAELIAAHLVPRFLRPRTVRQAPRGLFPSKSAFGADCPDPISAKVYEPFFRRWAERCARLRVLQQGKVHVYLVYIVLTVVLALAWVSLRRWWDIS